MNHKKKTHFDEFMELPLLELKRILASGMFDRHIVYEDKFVLNALKLAIEEKEKEQESKRLRWHSPLLVGITSAVIGAVVTGVISIYVFHLERQERAKEINTLQAMIKDKNSELTKSINEKDRLRAEIKDAISSNDPSKLISVMDEINNQRR